MKVRSLALGLIVAVFVPAAQAADKPAERAARVALPRRQLLPQPGPFWGTKLSRDGQKIAFARGGRGERPRIFVVPFAGGSAQPLTPPEYAARGRAGRPTANVLPTLPMRRARTRSG